MEKLKTPGFRPRALFERFRIEVLATTDSPLDSLSYHKTVRASAFEGRIIPTLRPNPVVDPDFPSFVENLASLGKLTHADTANFQCDLSALRNSLREARPLEC